MLAEDLCKMMDQFVEKIGHLSNEENSMNVLEDELEIFLSQLSSDDQIACIDMGIYNQVYSMVKRPFCRGDLLRSIAMTVGADGVVVIFRFERVEHLKLVDAPCLN